MGDAADPRDGRRTFIVPAIKPFDHYDFSRAKIACNLAWLVAKAFGTVIVVITPPRNLSWFRYYWKEVDGTQTTLILTFVTMAAIQDPWTVPWPLSERSINFCRHS
eukprot:bmy_21106T0